MGRSPFHTHHHQLLQKSFPTRSCQGAPRRRGVGGVRPASGVPPTTPRGGDHHDHTTSEREREVDDMEVDGEDDTKVIKKIGILPLQWF